MNEKTYLHNIMMKYISKYENQVPLKKTFSSEKLANDYCIAILVTLLIKEGYNIFPEAHKLSFRKDK